jgi:hypothetical protein
MKEEKNEKKVWDLKVNPEVCEKIVKFDEEFDKVKEELCEYVKIVIDLENKMEKLHRRMWDEIYDIYPELEDIHVTYHKGSMTITETDKTEQEKDELADFLKRLLRKGF